MERSAQTERAGRTAVASYSSYRDAVLAVDRLADGHFPVERAAIVGHGLRLVENITARVGHGGAARDGAFLGGVIGGLFGFLVGVFDAPLTGLTLGIYGLGFGGAVGALVGLFLHRVRDVRRDFASEGTLDADRYDVVVDEEVAEQAARLLDGPPTR